MEGLRKNIDIAPHLRTEFYELLCKITERFGKIACYIFYEVMSVEERKSKKMNVNTAKGKFRARVVELDVDDQMDDRTPTERSEVRKRARKANE